MDLKEIGFNTRNWVDSTQDRDKQRAVVNVALYSEFQNHGIIVFLCFNGVVIPAQCTATFLRSIVLSWSYMYKIDLLKSNATYVLVFFLKLHKIKIRLERSKINLQTYRKVKSILYSCLCQLSKNTFLFRIQIRFAIINDLRSCSNTIYTYLYGMM